MQELKRYAGVLEQALSDFELPQHPANLYSSIEYILSLGGKRLRPIMVLMSADTFGEIDEDASKAALVIELFHNFSLMHDDIMDKAELRRGKPSVHIKWNEPTAILGGDALLVKTYQILNALKSERKTELIDVYNKTALEVCEGQQMDMNFEKQDNVQVNDYLEMIRLKTAVLMGASFQMGAMLSKANEKDLELIYDYGQNLGIAFQIKDDFLDCFGEESFGKKVGGDILENKKTYLQLMSLSLGDDAQIDSLKAQWNNDNSKEKIEKVKSLFEATGAKSETHKAMEEYYQKAINCAEQLSISANKKDLFKDFAEYVWQRQV